MILAKRRRLFEFSDQRWLPRFFRHSLLDILDHFLPPLYQEAAPDIIALLKKTGTSSVQDLCSGRGGIWANLYENGLQSYQVQLSDLYPCQKVTHTLPYSDAPLDARALPTDSTCIFTIFNSFHHFRDHDAKNLLAHVASHKNSFLIIECTERSTSFMIDVLRSMGTIFKIAPTLWPRSPLHLFFTYILPIIPIMYGWDAIVSAMRTHTIDELQCLYDAHTNDGYLWEVGQIDGIQPLSYLLGRSIDK